MNNNVTDIFQALKNFALRISLCAERGVLSIRNANIVYFRKSYTFAPESFEEIEDIDTLNISRLSVDRI